jgi:hypothetical protein
MRRRGSDSGPVMGLEQRCVEPGYWRIEGYDVYRVTQFLWRIVYFKEEVALCGTLRECREWIRERLFND